MFVLVVILLVLGFLAVLILASRPHTDSQATLFDIWLRGLARNVQAGSDRADIQVIKARKQRAEALAAAEEAEARLELERLARGESPELAVAMLNHEIQIEALRFRLEQCRALREKGGGPGASLAPSTPPLEIVISETEIERTALRIAQGLSKTSTEEAERQLAIVLRDLNSKLPPLVVEEIARRASKIRELTL